MVKQLLTSSIQTSERATNCHLNVHTALFSCQRVSEHIGVIEDDIWRDRSKNKRIWEVKTCQILFPREDSLKLMEKKLHLWQVFITCFSSLPSFNCCFFFEFSEFGHDREGLKVFHLNIWFTLCYSMYMQTLGEKGQGQVWGALQDIYYLTAKTIQMDLLTLFFLTCWQDLVAVLLTACINTQDID